MTTEREVIQRKRAVLKQQWGALFTTVAAILFELDPMGINFESNTDEYEPEAGTIIPRLAQASNPQDVETIVHEEFCRWFGVDEAGTRASYAMVAARIWDAWSRFNQSVTRAHVEAAADKEPGSPIQS